MMGFFKTLWNIITVSESGPSDDDCGGDDE